MKAKVKAKKAKRKTLKNPGEGDSSKDSSKVRKLEKKQRFTVRLQENQKLSVKKTIGKKRTRTREKAAKAFSSLSSLLDSLPTQEEVIASSASFKKKLLTSKSHQKVVVKETKQLAAVLAHPEFQSDPFAAIQQHLNNTLPPVEVATKKPDSEKKKKKKKKKGKSKDDLMVE